MDYRQSDKTELNKKGDGLYLFHRGFWVYAFDYYDYHNSHWFFISTHPNPAFNFSTYIFGCDSLMVRLPITSISQSHHRA